MAGQEQHAELIDKLLARKRAAGGLVACRNARRGNVVEGPAAGIDVRIDQFTQVMPNTGTGVQHRLVLADLLERRIEDQRLEFDLCRAALEDLEGIEHIACDL